MIGIIYITAQSLTRLCVPRPMGKRADVNLTEHRHQAQQLTFSPHGIPAPQRRLQRVIFRQFFHD
jgi:hypothetical protein